MQNIYSYLISCGHMGIFIHFNSPSQHKYHLIPFNYSEYYKHCTGQPVILVAYLFCCHEHNDFIFSAWITGRPTCLIYHSCVYVSTYKLICMTYV